MATEASELDFRFSDEFFQRYSLFSLKKRYCNDKSCYWKSNISTKIYSVDKKLGKPKLHTMRKIYSAVHFGPPQIVPVRKFGMKVSFFFQVLALKLSK